jgi:hypothetical protein
MTTTPKARRQAYRKQARADLCRPAFWLFTASLYAITFIGATVLIIAGSVVAYLLHTSVGALAEPFTTAFWWANLIEACFLIAITVLYVWGGMSGIPFKSSHRPDGEETKPYDWR